MESSYPSIQGTHADIESSPEHSEYKWGYCIHLFSSSKELSSIWLPVKAEGFYSFPGEIYNFLHIEGKNGQWLLKCSAPSFFKNVPFEQYDSCPITGSKLQELECGENQFFIFCEPVSRAGLTYISYPLHSECELHIGTSPLFELSFQNHFYTGELAILSRSHSQWSFHCSMPEVPIYINGTRASSGTLKIGDHIFILGTHIVLGYKMISINNGDSHVHVHREIIKLSSAHHSRYGYTANFSAAPADVGFFNRLPRKFFHWEPSTITIEAPPMPLSKNPVPLLLRMGGSMVMSGRAAMMGNYTMLLTSVLFPFLSTKFGDQQQKEYEQKRVCLYTEYLKAQKENILQACADQEQAENMLYPHLDSILDQAVKSSHIWERRPADDDFLTLRLGSGSCRASSIIEYPERRFQLETDDLEEKMYELAETPYYLQNIPITLSLTQDRVCGILGSRSDVLKLIGQLLLQITICHSYDEVKIIFLADPEDAALFHDIRYLPHLWNDQKSVRFLATSQAETFVLSEYLKDLTADRKEDRTAEAPHYVVFVLSKSIFNSFEFIKNALCQEDMSNFSFLTAMDDPPKECSKVVTLHEDGHHILQSMVKSPDPDRSFTLDTYSADQARLLLMRLYNLSLKAIVMEQELPKTITFLDMFHAASVEQLNPLKRWTENDPIHSLAAPVGVHVDGSPFLLDLHEKRQGPHGLVAGMTGSGKSEFIITYILSMAVNYHPDEVAFILIDYKGGGLAGAFDNPKTGLKLPHLVGTITNLDGSEIERSLMSIESELLRRQRLFNEVKNQVNEGTLDIYDYQKLYRMGKASEPIPHLFIISDEFAELKAQEPEFMQDLISAARIGRSLGVHLILATQKPGGVVDDQIRSNSKFRVCLRVQERSDSMDMLKRGDAAELRDAGRFYLQVGYNEYFAIGQSAWCGAPYVQKDQITIKKDEEIEFLSPNGQVIAKAKPPVSVQKSDKKQVVAVVEYLAKTAERIHFHAKDMWKPPLPDRLDWDEPETLSPFEVCIGRLDDPENQDQYPATVDIAHCQHLLITGSPGSGKSTLMTNILRSLVLHNAPGALNFYILDFSSRTMKQFAPLPHCGGVLQEEDSVSFDSFFKLIDKIISQRKRLFSRLGVDNYDSANQLSPLPLVLVIIDNLPSLGQSKVGDRILYDFPKYLKGTSVYGVQFLLSCSHSNDLSNRIRQEIGDKICLHMKDKFAYMDILNCTVSRLPPDKPGRGLFCYRGQPLEIQTAMYLPDASDTDRKSAMKAEITELCEKYRGAPTVLHLPVVSDTATYEEFSSQFEKLRFPLGFSKATRKPVALPLKQFSGLSVYTGNPDGRIPIIENFLFAAQREGMELVLLRQSECSCFSRTAEQYVDPAYLENARIYGADAESRTEFHSWMKAELARRRKILDQYITEKKLPAESVDDISSVFPCLVQEFKPVFILIEHFPEFCTGLDLLQMLQFGSYLNKAYCRHIYVAAFFQPDDPPMRSINSLYSGFNPSQNIMLFGGNLNRQPLCTIPGTVDDKLLPYNSCVMSYNGQFYPLLMPCGELQTSRVDPDTESIF